MTGSLFEPPSIDNPAVARAVALLLTTGDVGAAAAEFLSEDPGLLIRGLAALAHVFGSLYYGSGADLETALRSWQDTREFPAKP